MFGKKSDPVFVDKSFSETISCSTPIGSELCFIKTKSDLGDECYNAVSDVFILMNNKRIVEDLGIDTVKHWLAQLAPTNDELSSKFDKLSDDELMLFVKSRHIQSPSELLQYSKALNSVIENMSEAAKEAAESNDVSSSDSDTSESDNN